VRAVEPIDKWTPRNDNVEQEVGRLAEDAHTRKVPTVVARLVRRPGLKRTILLTIVAAFSFGVVGSAGAKTTMVCMSGCPYTSIADAIADASSGKTVTVGPGTYTGGIVIDKSVKLVGSGLDQTVIQGGGMVVTVGKRASLTLVGVTVTGGMPDGSLPGLTSTGGILNAGRLTLRDSAVSNNQALANGGGIYNYGKLRLTRSLIHGNSSGGSYNGGGGIYNDHGSVVINDSAMTENAAYLGGGVYNDDGTVKLDGASVNDNSAAGGGGILNDGLLAVTESTLSGNTVSADVGRAGGGGAIDNSGTMTITATAITANRAYFGGGIFNTGTVTINGGLIDGNTGNYAPGGPDGSGGGISNLGTLKLRGTVVSNNTLIPGGEGDGGGIFNTTSGTLVVQGGAMIGNIPDDCAGC